MNPTLRVIFVSYERELTQPSSEVFERVEGLAEEGIVLSAVVLPATQAGVVEQGHLRSIGLTGSAPIRLWKAFRAAGREVRRAVRQGEQPLLSAQDPFVTGTLAFVVSRLWNVPYEVQEHGDYFSGAWVREAPVRHRLWSWIGRGILRHADHVRVVSERIRNRLTAQNISADRTTVIPVVQNVAPLLARSETAWPEVPTIVVPCRFVKQKGLDTLLGALANVAANGHAFHVRLVGEGAEGPHIATLAEQKGIRDRISFEHWSDSKAVWQKADLFILSSNYEGWGRTIVEAMAAGVPTVTTDVGCVGSFFRPEKDGLMVPPGDAAALADAITAQLTQHSRRAEMAASARERVQDLPTAEALRTVQRGAWRKGVGYRASRTAWKWTALIVAFAAALRLVSFLWFGDTLGANREWGFFRLVEGWFNGNGYAFIPGQLSAYRSPGFLFFLTAVYGVFGFANFAAQAFIQNLLAVLLVYLVYRLGWRVTDDRRVGWVAALLITVHPYTFYHYTQYYHTVLSGLFLVSVLLSLFALNRTRQLRWAVWMGVMTAALAYVQGTILVAMPFLAFWILWQWRADLRRAVVVVAIIAMVSAGLIAPWTFRNWQTFHAFVPLTTDLGFALYKANTENYERLLIAGYPHEALEEEAHPTDPFLVRYWYLPEVRAMLEQTGGIQDAAYWTAWHVREPSTVSRPLPVSEVVQNKYWMSRAQEWMRAHPVDFARLALRKAIVFWQPALHPSIKYGAPWSFGNNSVVAMAARWSLTVYVAVLELLAIAGLVMMVRRKHLRALIPLLIICIAYTAMHMLFAPYTKYRIPLDNLVVIVAAIGLVGAWLRLRPPTAKK